jgi:hypothetical protein
VQTFYQPLFSHSFPFSNSSSFQKLPTPKIPKQKPKSKAQKTPQSKSPQPPLKAKAQHKVPKSKSKSSLLSFSGPFINSGKQDGAEALKEGCDIVTGETCVPASLNTNLGDATVLLFFCFVQGLCPSQPTGKSN